MSNETKRELFKTRAYDCAGINYELYKQYLKQYDAALPDDLPVIPKAVGEYIKWGKTYGIPTYMMYSFKFIHSMMYSLKFIHSQGFKELTDTDDVESWIISSSNAFALAWLLGVWRIEETGEIVKLEEEK